MSEACSGATTATVLGSQLSALSSATTLVSITVGGNDVGFSSVMETCVLLPQSSCVSAVQHVADVRSAFSGHEICDSGSWLHSVNFLDVSESYHPTASGQSGGYEPVFSAAAG